ncbi:Hypothetical predicted protein [Cloeon dipterum]|uniref:Copper transport protein ATOX1 n=1 Tax=Cloeon dipterum TaxID=197152 RepID=A0A8S1DG54_9INSE|nr:Hypothetical predicted protein [Cloeon dipterum]
MTKVHEFTVEMTCEGCSGAVERVLGKLKDKGVDKVEISLEKQQVLVTSSLDADSLLETIKKTGKATTFVSTRDA